MKTFAFVVVSSLLAVASSGLAQETGIATGDIVGPLPPVGPTCFRLQDPADQCVIASPTIVNYSHPQFNVVDLNGAWRDQSGYQPYIYLYKDSNYAAGYTIAVD